jgi:hypothetical protein
VYAHDFSIYEISFVVRNQLEIVIDDVRRNSDFVSCHDLGILVKMVHRLIIFSFGVSPH